MSQVRYYVVLEVDASEPTILQTTVPHSEWGSDGKTKFIFVYGYETDWTKACDFLHLKQNKPSVDGLPC